jgi:hypothetical protein
MKSVSVKSHPSMFRRGMAKPINLTMFVEIFSIIGGNLSTISGSMFQTITFFPSLVNYVVLSLNGLKGNNLTVDLFAYSAVKPVSRMFSVFKIFPINSTL